MNPELGKDLGPGRIGKLPVQLWASSSPLRAHFPSLCKQREGGGGLGVLSAVFVEMGKVLYLLARAWQG